jgi:Short C-terminal domain
VAVELDRLPARIGPRLSAWAVLMALWCVFTGLYVLAAALEGAAPGGGPVIIPAFLAFGSGAGLLYVRIRLTLGDSVTFWGGSRWGMTGDAALEGSRPSDPEERTARRRLRRGEITRAEYERTIAFRHFVHGEISRAEYHELVRQISEQESASPPSI